MQGVNLEDNAVVVTLRKQNISFTDDGDGEWLTKQLQK